MQRSIIVRRAACAAAAAAGLVVVGASSAAAHVTIDPSTTEAGAASELTVVIPHGCDGSATTAISIRVPEEVSGVDAVDTDRWAAEVTPGGLTYTTGDPLPDDEQAEVAFSAQLPDEVGATLAFPVIQQCEEGEAAWTEVAEHGDGHDELDKPAPVLVVTGSDTESVDAELVDAEVEATDGGVATDASTSTEEQDSLVAYGAIAAGVGAALVVAVVLLRRRRHR